VERETPQTNGYVRELSRDEGRELFDRKARQYLGVSGDDFIRGLEAGEYGDPDERPEVMRLIMLLPFAR
jgi:hypothetical protein